MPVMKNPPRPGGALLIGEHMSRVVDQPQNPSGLCQCGCGKKTPLAIKTQTAKGWIKGQPTRYCHGHGGGREPIPLEDRFWNYVDKDAGGGCWEWTKKRMESGYGMTSELRKTLLAHRVAYELSKGPIPEGLVVRHSCDNPPCCNPDHLLLGTYADNTEDAVSRNRVAFGERVHSAKLTAEEVREARIARAGGATISALSRKYLVARSTIRNAIKGKTWSRV